MSEIRVNKNPCHVSYSTHDRLQAKGIDLAKTQFIYGQHAASAMLSSHPQQIQKCFFLRSRKPELQRLADIALAANIAIEQMSRHELETKVGKEAVHQGVVLQCDAVMHSGESQIPSIIENAEQPLVLVLDQVQDPHNLGACMRSANAMGACCVIVPKDRSASLTPTVQKVACGATVSTPLIQVTNLSRVLTKLQDAGLWVVGLSATSGCSLSEIDLSGPLVVVMGGEGKGMRSLTEKKCDYLARIPMTGTVESLNVSVATGIVLYEVSRQRTN